MQRLNSVSLLIMGTGFLLLALIMNNLLLQGLALFISMGLNITAILRSFREKNKNL